MEQRAASGASPFADTTSLDAVRRGQERFGVRAGLPCKHKAELREDDVGVFYIPREPVFSGTALYLHGGGFVSGGGAYAGGVAALLAGKLGIRVCCAELRLAPEHPYPAALDDAEHAYRALLEREGAVACLLGDSSGGGLCFSLALRLKAKGLPLPSAIAAFSPWCDLTLSTLADDDGDGMLDVPLLRDWAGQYARGAAPDDPELSPVYGDLSGLPPVFLCAGDAELLCGDSRRLLARLQAAGVPAELVLGAGMWHTYPLSGVRESRAAMERLAVFLKKHLCGGAV
jgi:monoterpene epsilon-lactone hydrolase